MAKVSDDREALRSIWKIFAIAGRRSAAPAHFINHVTQGSQSLALGLATAAASQLVEELIEGEMSLVGYGRRSAAPGHFIHRVTQGSQSLALGLATAAASQLVEGLIQR